MAKRIDYLLFFIVYFLGTVIVLNAQENKIENITISGNIKTKSEFLLQFITSKVGDLVDENQLENDKNVLIRLPAIANAEVVVACNDSNNCTVEFKVVENRTIIPIVNFWTTTNNVFSYKLGLYDYNFLGKNITLGGFYQFNGFDTYALNFAAPQLFSKKWGLAINFQNWKSEEPLYFGANSANYLYQNKSFEVLALYQPKWGHSFQFGATLFKENYHYISGVTSPTIPQQLSLNKQLLKFAYNYNQLNYNYFYVEGWQNILYAQYVLTENNFQNEFLIFWNDLLYFKTKGNGNWANRLRFGLSTNENTPFAPFALDNNVNLRGVGILVDRGTGTFVLNTEYRYTIFDKNWLAIQTNVFTDVGSWRNPGGELSDFFDEKNIRVYSGFGLRFINKKVYNAIFRIDYGFGLTNTMNNSKGGFVFGIGQYF